MIEKSYLLHLTEAQHKRIKLLAAHLGLSFKDTLLTAFEEYETKHLSTQRASESENG
jgi:hypothetical protein